MTDLTTPEQGTQLQTLRDELVAWLLAQADKGTDHRLSITALMLAASSGVVSAGVSKTDFLAMVSRYYDLYEAALQRRASA